MTTIKEKARRYADPSITPSTYDTDKYPTIFDSIEAAYEAGFQECARLTLAEPTEDELRAMMRAWSDALATYEGDWELMAAACMRAAFSTFCKLRGINPKVQSQ